MQEKILSVVVPSYNIERFIDRLMDSLIRGMGENADRVEILLVNDGSSDRTPALARGYEERYPGCVRLLDKENGGHGSTINLGIREASGVYVRALDGDDWVDPEAFAALLTFLAGQDVQADMIICDYNTVNEKTGEVRRTSYEALPADRLLKPAEVLDPKVMYPYHSVVYRTELLRECGLLLDEHCFYVDTEYVLFPIPSVQSFRHFPQPVYQYRIGGEDQSVSRASYLRNRKQLKRVLLHLCQFAEKEKEGMSPAAYRYILNAVSWVHYTLFEAVRGMEDHKKAAEELRGVDRGIFAVSKDAYRSARPVVKAARLLGYSRLGTGISDLRNRFLK